MSHQARKRFGQHFLIDQSILARLLGEIRPTSSEHVVEIGPGLGALTQWLIKSIDALHVIEIDRDLVKRLLTGPMHKKLIIHEADVLDFDFATLPTPLRVVGNLPYNISSPILFKLLDHADHIQDQHFMLQKEVVDRMVASPGTADYGRLSVMLQAYYDMESLFDVPPESFDPPPRVMSAIVRMTPKAAAQRHSIPGKLFATLVQSAFSQRRKMLRNTWADLVNADIARGCGIELTQRAEQVEPLKFVALAKEMVKHSL